MNHEEHAEGPPGRAMDLLFIHHSCGGDLMAEPGPASGADCICPTSPNGGGLRKGLEGCGYRVHEASYGSRVGQNTDIFDWAPKFREHMEEVLSCAGQDARHEAARRNEVVMFKSCFPNNAFRSAGEGPGDGEGPELTVWNAKAAYAGLLAEFGKHPRVLFVCLTAPPLARESWWKRAVKRVRREGNVASARSGVLARQFNNWLSGSEGWLKGYEGKNVAVFDYYDVLTQGGQSNFSMYATGDGSDSHPSRVGNEKAARAFVSFLNRAVRRAGLSAGRAEGKAA